MPDLTANQSVAANTAAPSRVVTRLHEHRRVLFIASSGNDGGIERHSALLGGHLIARGLDVSYACRPRGLVELLAASYGIPTVNHYPRNSGDILSFFRLASTLIHGDYDIVHVHSRRDFLPAMAAVSIAKRRTKGRVAPKLLLHVHLIRSLGLAVGVNRWAYTTFTDGIAVVSKAVRDAVLAGNIIDEAHVVTVYNGVDLGAYAEAGSPIAKDRREEVRALWGVPSSAPVIGMVGRLDAKGQLDMLALMPALIKAVPDLRLVLVGSDAETVDQKWLLTEARELGVAANVVVPGPTSDVPAAMAGFDALAHLPADEAFGSVLVEAMAAGLPIVASNVGGCPEVVVDEVTGFIVPLGDGKAAVEQLTRLFDPEYGVSLRAKMGSLGAARARSLFSLDRQLDALDTLYGKLCGRSAS